MKQVQQTFQNQIGKCTNIAHLQDSFEVRRQKYAAVDLISGEKISRLVSYVKWNEDIQEFYLGAFSVFFRIMSAAAAAAETTTKKKRMNTKKGLFLKEPIKIAG